MIFDLVKDFADVLQAMPPDHPRYRILKLLDEAIRRDVHFIERHPTTLFQFLWNTCWWYDCPEAAEHYLEPEGGWKVPPSWMTDEPKLYQLLEKFRTEREQTGFCWVRSLRPPKMRLGTAQRAVLKGHENAVNSVVFSPDGRFIASGSEDRSIRVWDAKTGQELNCLWGHEKAVASVAYSPNGCWIASGSDDQTVRLWEAETGREFACLLGHEHAVAGVVFSPDGQRIASASWDKTVRVWHIEARQELACLRGHGQPVTGVAFSPDGWRIASASRDGTIRVWDGETGKELTCVRGTVSSLGNSLAFSSDGRQTLGWIDQTLRRWDTETGREVACLQGKVSDWLINSVAFSSDGRWIASGNSYSNGSFNFTGAVQVWDTETGWRLECLRGHDEGVTSVAFSLDGRWIASGSTDQTIRVWEVGGAQETIQMQRSGGIKTLTFSADGRQIVSGSEDRSVRVWDTETGREQACFMGHDSGVTAVAFSPDGQRIASGSRDKTIRVWDCETGREIACLQGLEQLIDRLEFSPDGRRIVSHFSSISRTARIWDADSGQELLCLKDQGANIAFSDDGRWIASGSAEQSVRIWDAETGREQASFRGHTLEINCVAFSPGGRRIASGSIDRTVRVWDTETGRELACLNAHKSSVVSVAFSPDGRWIASGSSDKSARIWDAETCRELACLHAVEEGEMIRLISFSPDSRRFASGAWNGTVRVWNTENWECIQMIRLINQGSAYKGKITFENAATGLPAAWFPEHLSYVVTHPNRRTWAGGVGWSRGIQLCLITLENFQEEISSSSFDSTTHVLPDRNSESKVTMNQPVDQLQGVLRVALQSPLPSDGTPKETIQQQQIDQVLEQLGKVSRSNQTLSALGKATRGESPTLKPEATAQLGSTRRSWMTIAMMHVAFIPASYGVGRLSSFWNVVPVMLSLFVAVIVCLAVYAKAFLIDENAIDQRHKMKALFAALLLIAPTVWTWLFFSAGISYITSPIVATIFSMILVAAIQNSSRKRKRG